MNPLLKTPQQMLLSKAGIPHLADGRSVGALTAGAAQLLETAVKRFINVFKRPPDQSEMAELTKHVQSFSAPARPAPNMERLAATTPAQDMLVDAAGNAYKPVMGPRGLTTPEQAAGYKIDPFGASAANMRARQGLYEPGVKAFENRDPFLTEAMTGRAPTRTRQKPFTTNIDDLNANKAALEEQGIYGNVARVEPGGYPAQSSTPSSDYFARMSAGIENAKLPDNIMSTFRAKFGRNPNEDEVNAIIAHLNVARHDYTGKGSAIFGERPTTAGGGRPTKSEADQMAAWREQAQASGMSPTSITAKPAELSRDFPQLSREMQMGPDTGFAHGGSTNPDYMRAEMVVNGYTPAKYAGGKSVNPMFEGIQESKPSDTDNKRFPSVAELKRMAGKTAKFGLGTALPGYFAYEGLSQLPENIGTGNYGDAAANAIYGVSGAAQAMPKTMSRLIGPAATSTASKAWLPLMAGQMLGHHGNLNEGEQELLRLYGSDYDYVDAERDPFFEGSVFSAQKR